MRSSINAETKIQEGFSMIEILIVIAIIGVLAAIAIPQYSKYRTSAMNSAAESELKNAMTALEGDKYTTGDHYPTTNVSSHLDFSSSETVKIAYNAPTNSTFQVCSWHENGNKYYQSNSSMNSIRVFSCSGSLLTNGKCTGCRFVDGTKRKSGDI